MTRPPLHALGLGVALVAALGAGGCSNAQCGPGTQRSQADNGNVVCLPVTVVHGDTECDADGGVSLVDGNRCVANIQCGPGTMLDSASHQCLAVAQSAHEPPVCTPPASGTFCVNGTLRNLVDGSYLSGQTVTVSLYDPTSFYTNPTPQPLAEVDATDTYRFADIPVSGTFVIIVTHDPSGAPGGYLPTGISAGSGDGVITRLDGYVVSKAQATAWNMPAKFDTQGAVIFRFMNDPPPPLTKRTPTETHPVAGVTLVDNNNAVIADALYLGASLAVVDSAATTTSATGGVISTSATKLGNFKGMGGGIASWEGHQTLMIPHALQVDFIHPQQ